MNDAGKPPTDLPFTAQQRLQQAAWFAASLDPAQIGHGGSAYRLLPQHRALNLAPAIRSAAPFNYPQAHRQW